MSRGRRIGKALALAGAAAAGTALVISACSNVRPAAHQGRPASASQAPAATRQQSSGGGVTLAQAAGGRTPAQRVDPPLTVTIPRLQVSAPVVERVSVYPSGPEKGLLGAPSNYHQLGWYEYGSSGVLLVDGHVGFASGAGPLAYIGLLGRGDPVIVRFAHRTVTYFVTAVVAMPKGQLPAAYFTSRYDGQLMLITCDYQSTFHDGHFADNVFVLAKP